MEGQRDVAIPAKRNRSIYGRSAYEFSFTTLTGRMALPLSEFEGKAVGRAGYR